MSADEHPEINPTHRPSGDQCLTRRLPAALGGFLWLLLGLMMTPAADAGKVHETVDLSRRIVDNALAVERPVIAGDLIEDTRCLAIFPRLRHAAFGLGGRHGLGVVSCRDRRGIWSPPAFLRITSGTLGLQLGFQKTELLIFFLSDKARESLVEPQMALGGDIHVAGGQRSHAAGVSTDPRLKSDVYLFENSSGAFLGAAVGGQQTYVATGPIRRLYGKDVAPRAILFDHAVPSLPLSAERLVEALGRLPYREPEIRIIDESVTPDEPDE